MSGSGRQSKLAEHVERDDRPDCRDDLAHLRYRNEETGETTEAGTFRCDSWDCACCGHRMKMNLLEGIDRVVEERPELSRLLTLTVDPARVVDREAAHRNIGKAWNRLRSFIQEAYGRFSYIWVREEQESGYPHLHVLVSRYLPQGQVAAAWDRAGMGSVVDIRAVQARQAGHYVAKYLAKDAMAFLPSGVHRYGSSADIDLGVRGGESDSEGEWSVVALDDVTGLLLDAKPADFIRRPDTTHPPPDDGEPPGSGRTGGVGGNGS